MSNKFPVLLSLSLALLFTGCIRSGLLVARIGDQPITEAEFKSVYQARKSIFPEDLGETERQARFLSYYLDMKVQSAAAREAGLTKHPDLQRRWKSYEKRIVHQKYRDLFIQRDGGVPEKSLLSWYQAHTDRFTGDSGKVVPFDSAREKVVADYLLQKANLDSFYTANRARYQKVEGADTILPPLAEKLAEVKKDFVAQIRDNLNGTLKDRMWKAYQVKLQQPKPVVDEKELRAYYQNNQANYQTQDAFETWHIQAADSATLARAVPGIRSLDDFKKQAALLSTDSATRSQGGFLGLVKRGFSLPYGLGLFPEIFDAFDSLVQLQGFQLTRPLKNSQTQKWHVFALGTVTPKAPKPFERARALVLADYQREKGESIAPEAELATYKGGGPIKEEDILFLRKEIPAHFQARYSREMLVEYVLMWDLAYLEAKKAGLLEAVDVTSTIATELEGYWAQMYKDSVLKGTFGVDTATLKKTFEANRGMFVTDTAGAVYEPRYAEDVALFLAMPPLEVEAEYHSFPERYMKDSTTPLSWEEVRSQAFQAAKPRFQTVVREKLNAGLWKKFKVEIIDSTLVERTKFDAIASFTTAQTYHSDRKLEPAIAQYQDLRYRFPDLKSLQDSVCLGLAQIQVELEKFPEALAEYRRLLFLYPESPNAYKAQFMIGFIYSENLKQNDKAIEAFQVILDKYKDCDLAEDADWMIRNIKSGGALMPKLEETPDETSPAEAAPPSPPAAPAKKAPAKAPAKAGAKDAKKK